MKQRLFRSTPKRALTLAIATAAIATAALVPALASGAGAGASAGTATILIKGSRSEPLKFVAPKTVVAGEDLEIKNTTDPKQIGPHTFSLVLPSLVPETKPDRKNCFTPQHICLSIAKWHGVKGEDSPPTKNPAKAGKTGWDTEGTVSKTGDSWFTSKTNQTYTQKVSAAPGMTLTFICAVHPWMHGSIEVVAAE